MAWDFGATTSDRLTFTNQLTIGASQRTALITGWWKPTTLTAGRALWSAGTGGLISAEVDTVTDELVLRLAHTTDSVATTNGVNLAVGEWAFLAFLVKTANTGPVSDWRVWRAGVQSPPAEVPVTVGTPAVGNPAGSNSINIGNKGTGTSAWQGQVSDFNMIVSAASASSTNPHFLGHTAISSATTQDQADWALVRFVEPIWRGEADEWWRRVMHVTDASIAHWSHLPMGGVGENVIQLLAAGQGATGGHAVTVAGSAAASQERGPRSRYNVHRFYRARR